MQKRLLLIAVGLLSCCWPAASQTVASPRYMQIFYRGAGWLSGRPVLDYSPAFRGKTGEVVAEPDSIRLLSPSALLFDRPTSTHDGPAVVTETTTTIGNGQTQTTYVRGKDGKLRPQTPADVAQERTRDKARFTRQLNLLDARAALARTALLNALNATAADGWEVVQMSQWGDKDGLTYLLRHQ